MHRHSRSIVAGLLLLLAAAAQADTYRVDPDHSSATFQVRHMTISKVKGSFGDLAGTFEFNPAAPDTWHVSATVGLASIDTGNAKRDDHLRSDEFFDAAVYPTMTFTSTAVQMKDEATGVLRGDLTMHGFTRPIVLDLEYNGSVTDPWGNQRAGFSATGTINRKDWGLTYNAVLETGGLAVGETVKIALEIEGIKVTAE